VLARASRQTEGWARSPREAASGRCGAEGLRGAPRAWRTGGGGARRTAARPCVSALGALLDHHTK